MLGIAMWILLVPVCLSLEACLHDWKRREIPDGLSARTALSGLAATTLSWHFVDPAGALLGMGLIFLAALPFTLVEGLGGGDLKLLTALGAWLGPGGALQLLFWTAMSGTVAACIASIRGEKDFAYAPAILTGLLISVCCPAWLPDLIDALRSVVLGVS